MSHDNPSRARPIIAFWGVETGRRARIKALVCTCTFIGWRSLAARLNLAILAVLLYSEVLPSYDVTYEEANDCVCVLAKARDPCT